MNDEKSIWFGTHTVESVSKYRSNNSAGHCGVEFVEIGPDYITAKMPVDERTRQPRGLLHGGMSVMLAETVASVGATLTVDTEHFACVGQEINANHVRSVKDGWVFATARPHYLGGRSQVWDIKIVDESDKLVCISRMTAAIVKR